MALDKQTLKNSIKDLFDFDSDKDVNPVEARERQAQKLANAIEMYVKSGDVTTNVVGTSATGGAVTGTGTGKLN
ncbi:hypothetical protein [Pedobacter sp. WC2423]|uniref:hypothetical protein n=1 Tax=Pedobacter sp. WC2423 TaxID=3234142 RepID=UPI0034678B3D